MTLAARVVLSPRLGRGALNHLCRPQDKSDHCRTLTVTAGQRRTSQDKWGLWQDKRYKSMKPGNMRKKTEKRGLERKRTEKHGKIRVF